MNREKKIRCAVYCRKSVEDEVEKEFNSIDAQREAGEMFIASQRGNGWVCLPRHYDDYGLSGGNMNRPALKDLLADCESGLVGIVIVYKVDRLSRSIVDFAELSKDFDKWGVNFVSVTQDINTSTSSGRMMLNILMTFAQYEREIISERTRDKMAASRKKGKWVGGVTPYGYRVEKGRLIIVPAQAKTVQNVFLRFCESQSPKLVAYELNKSGLTTRKGKAWTKGHIYRILNNFSYIGKVNYKGHVCKGEQDAIIDDELWKRTHEILSGNAPVKEFKGKVETVAPLRGVIHCGHCNGAMSPIYTRKDGKNYYYYICSKDEKRGERICPIGRMPAGDVEQIVRNKISELLSNPEFVSIIAAKAECEPLKMREFFKREMWEGMTPMEQNRLINLLIEKITVWSDSLEFEFKTQGMKFIMEDFGSGQN